jgi:hypothetical protein
MDNRNNPTMRAMALMHANDLLRSLRGGGIDVDAPAGARDEPLRPALEAVRDEIEKVLGKP